MSARRAVTALLVVPALAAVAGCGVDTKDADKDKGVTKVITTRTVTRTSAAKPKVRLPARPSGVVSVEGTTQGSLTPLVAPQVSGVNVQVSNADDGKAFRDLCNGRIDAVDSARPIGPSEFEACRRTGVNPVQFQVAADATVIATKNETDVGLDCLTLQQVRDVFRAGSGINNWSQLGGFAQPLHTTGPDERGNGFGFFARYVLGSDPPTLSALRGDYKAQASDGGTRAAVVGTLQDQKDAKFAAKANRDLRALRAAIAEKRVLIDKQRGEVAKGKRDKRPAATQANDAKILRQERSQLAGLLRDLPPAIAFQHKAGRANARLLARTGVIGIFRFSYYELFEEQLRPLEVDAGSTTDGRRDCVFPSQDTITSATFPLARQLLITVTQRGLKRAEVQTFLRAYLASAQALATRQRLVPLPDDQVALEQQWLRGEVVAPVVYYPPGARATTRGRTVGGSTASGTSAAGTTRTSTTVVGTSTTGTTSTASTPTTTPSGTSTVQTSAPTTTTTTPAGAGAGSGVLVGPQN